MTESQLVTKMRAVSVNDMMLAGYVNDALQADRLLRRTGTDGIAITVKDGVVILSGHVRSTTDKTQAERAAHNTPDIVRFENQLIADDKLAIAVAYAVDNDERMDGEQVGINAQRGFIYLTGSVSSAAIRLSAANIAAGVPNVRGIVNRIQAPDVVIDGAEERLFQPTIGQAIYTASDELGTVHQVIIHPHNRRVTAVVADASCTNRHSAPTQLTRQSIIAVDALRCAPSGALFLNRTDDKTVTSGDFHAHSFVTPPVDWQPPFPYSRSDVLFHK